MDLDKVEEILRECQEKLLWEVNNPMTLMLAVKDNHSWRAITTLAHTDAVELIHYLSGLATGLELRVEKLREVPEQSAP